MFNFKRLLYTTVGKIFISILLGLGIASLFRRACKDRDCIVFNGPVISQVEGRVFQYGDDCYTYKQRATTCKTAGENNMKVIDVSPAPTLEEGGTISPSDIPPPKPIKVSDISGVSQSNSTPSLFGIFGGSNAGGGAFSIFGGGQK